jgi:hypothetical protein
MSKLYNEEMSKLYNEAMSKLYNEAMSKLYNEAMSKLARAPQKPLERPHYVKDTKNLYVESAYLSTRKLVLNFWPPSFSAGKTWFLRDSFF